MRPADRVLVDVALPGDEAIELTAFTTLTPGLVVVEIPGRGWSVTHERSGLGIGGEYDDPETAQMIAAQLADVTDWTVPGQQLVNRNSELVPLVQRITDLRLGVRRYVGERLDR